MFQAGVPGELIPSHVTDDVERGLSVLNCDVHRTRWVFGIELQVRDVQSDFVTTIASREAEFIIADATDHDPAITEQGSDVGKVRRSAAQLLTFREQVPE